METSKIAPIEEPFVMWQRKNEQLLKELKTDRESTLLLYKYTLAKKRTFRKKEFKEPRLPDMFRDIAHKAVAYQFWSISQGQRHYRLTWAESRAICYKMHELRIVIFNGYYVTDILIKTNKELIKKFNSRI